MKWTYKKAEPGDILKVNFGLVFHFGIYVNDEEIIQFGLPPIDKNDLYRNDVVVLSTNIKEFSLNHPYEVSVFSLKEKIKKNSRQKTIKIAKSHLGEGGYNFIHNNCEHFVYLCAFNKKYSEQSSYLKEKLYSSPICHLYVSSFPFEIENKDIYPKEREEEIYSCTASKVIDEKFYAWKLLEKGIKQSLSLSLKDVEPHKLDNGKWVLKDHYISISHSGNIVAVAISKLPVGVDVQEVKEVSDSLIEKVLTKNEKSAYTHINKFSFARLWSIKESLFKKSNDLHFIPNKVDSFSEKSKTYFINDNDYVLSIIGDDTGFLKVFTSDDLNLKDYVIVEEDL